MAELEIVEINTLFSFEEVRKEWDNVYISDPYSTIYISWFWLYGLFSSAQFKWIVLGVKEAGSSSYVAFLPLKIHKIGAFGIYPIRQLEYAGMQNLTYSGLLCLPGFETKAIEVLFSEIQVNLSWDRLSFNMIKDPRLGILLGKFSEPKYSSSKQSDFTTLCITLPNSYDSYLKEFISRESRWSVKRKTRNLLEDNEFEITCSNAKTINRDIDALCKLWFNRWKQKERMDWHKLVMHRYFEKGLLKLSIIWDGNVLVSAVACLLDPEKRTYNLYITSYNPKYHKLSPGIVLTAESIKQAIEHNYRFYDFTGGLDRYKLSFGPERYESIKVLITKKNLKTVLILTLMKQLKRIVK